MPTMKNIKHISLDLWMTLIRSHPSYKSARASLLSTFFKLDGYPQERIEAVFRDVDREVNDMNELTGNSLSSNELYILVISRLLGRKIKNLTLEMLEEFYATSERLFFQFQPIPLYDNLPELLSPFRANGLTVGLLSNTGFIQGRTLRKLMEKLGWEEHLDFQLYSDETGYSKPSKKMFNELRKVSRGFHPPSLAPGQIWHLGDNANADVHGAREAGMKATLTDVEKNPLNKILQEAAAYFDTALNKSESINEEN